MQILKRNFLPDRSCSGSTPVLLTSRVLLEIWLLLVENRRRETCKGIQREEGSLECKIKSRNSKCWHNDRQRERVADMIQRRKGGVLCVQ